MTAVVVLLSVVSLTVIIAAGAKDKGCRSYGVCAAVALAMMLVGAVGMKIVPAESFGIVERFSVFAATGFNAALGVHLFRMPATDERNTAQPRGGNEGCAALYHRGRRSGQTHSQAV